MEYKRVVQTVVETPTYLTIPNKLFSEEERADIVALVAADPECGDLIRETGGFRKVRVARKGMGKSGGARVVYIWHSERFPVFPVTVFPKNEKENLSKAERNTLKKRADSIFETYGR
ncbi:MAG: type II toxin-antitoxin system RelE/ParE family toxin [Candidatus Sulfotelmatobacter sp.]